jgi:hypothetical protein
MHGSPGSPSDFDRLVKWIEEAVTEPGPLMGYVGSAEPSRDGGKLD